jgi:hypothetical protein
MAAARIIGRFLLHQFEKFFGSDFLFHTTHTRQHRRKL